MAMTIEEIEDDVTEIFSRFKEEFRGSEYDIYDSYKIDGIMDSLEEYFNLLMEKIDE